MSNEFPVLRSLDPYHQRIGYLGALALVADRGLDTRSAIRSRLELKLFNKLRTGEEAYNYLLRDVPTARHADLTEVMEKRDAEEDPAAILYDSDQVCDWLYTSELWLHQKCMRSILGFVSKKKLGRIIDLARWTGVLTPLMELSETGFILQVLLESERKKEKIPELFNPLDPAPRDAVKLMYTRLILAADVLWPYLVVTISDTTGEQCDVKTRGQPGLLSTAVERQLNDAMDESDPAIVLELREISKFYESIQKNASTEDNYLRPRLEQLVDLEIMEKSAGKGKKLSWRSTATTHLLATEWAQLTGPEANIHEYLEHLFFGSMARVFNKACREVTEVRETLRWFVRAYEVVGREIGFTPGRTVAVLACLLAFEDDVILEVSDVFDVVYESASSEWSRYLKFSGGSRLDREFMIYIDPALAEQLEVKRQDNQEA